jgi:nicotinamidase-related amidase
MEYRKPYNFLSIENTVLVLIDIQEKLFPWMHRKEDLLNNLLKLIRCTKILGIPVIWNEQNPAGIGPTIPEIAGLLPGMEPLTKMSFNCCGNEAFLAELKSLNRRQVLISGIETHVCVYQTTMELLNLGYEVQVVSDTVSSRTPENRQIGLEKVKSAGAGLTGTETAVFELLKAAGSPQFKEILKIIK